MIDFAKLITPHVIPPVPERFAVRGIRTGACSNISKFVRCVFEVRDKRALYIVEGGVTGYESLIIQDWMKHSVSGPWLACAGTKDRWDSLEIEAISMAAVMKWALRKAIE